MYNNVKLAPLKGSTREEMSNVQLKSLTELFLTDPTIPRENNLTREEFISGHNTDFPEEKTKIIDSGDSNNSSSNSFCNSNKMNIRSSPRFIGHSTSIPLSSRQTSVYLDVNDVNCLWTVYLNQQLKLGDISDRQAMAKSYHSLDADQVQVLKDLNKKSHSSIEATAISSFQDKKRKTNEKSRDELPRKSRKTSKALPKSVNRRQQRKKKIRDELKKQLSTFTTLSETEGFPWKAIVSKSGFRDLKLVGWPRVIPRLKRIDDFNPTELDIFEEGLEKGSIKITRRKK